MIHMKKTVVYQQNKVSNARTDEERAFAELNAAITAAMLTRFQNIVRAGVSDRALVDALKEVVTFAFNRAQETITTDTYTSVLYETYMCMILRWLHEAQEETDATSRTDTGRPE